MDFHVITPRGSELIMQLVGGQVVIVPPAPAGHQVDRPLALDRSETRQAAERLQDAA
jgi:hypothetical protein